MNSSQPNWSQFGQFVRKQRETQDYTVAQLLDDKTWEPSPRPDISTATWKRIEAGTETNPHASTIEAVQKALD